MKVLQIINSLATGGAEKLLLDTIPKYREEGIEMDILLLNGRSHPFLGELAKRKDIAIHTLGEGSVYNPFHIFKLRKFLKKYDLIHVHLFPALYWMAFAKMSSFSNTPLVFTEHNTSNRRRDHWLLKRVDRIAYQQYTKIVTIAPEVDSELKNHLNFSNDVFEFIQNGVDIDEIGQSVSANRKDFNISDEQKILIQVSSFTTQKDQQTLIKSLSLLTENVVLLLVGEGPLKGECELLVNELNLTDRVQFLGVRMDVPSLLKMADIVVLSTNYEGLSLSSIEALASGRPFVAASAPGLTPIVTGAGVLFAVGDEKALAQEILKLLSSQSYYTEVANKCIERAQHYSIDKMISKHIALYKSLVSN